MRGFLTLIALVFLVPLAGCGPSEAEVYAELERTHMDVNWVMPAEVKIDNFHEDGRAECVLKIHNGHDATTETQMFSLTTVVNDTFGTFILKKPLGGADPRNVLEVLSDNYQDRLTISEYDADTQTLMIIGFAPSTKRTVTITYSAWSRFLLVYKPPYNLREGYETPPNEAAEWVTISEPSPVLGPKETRDILVALEMPKGASIPQKKWELWISVMEDSADMIQTELIGQALVTMR
jgi:hypothetical protein